MGERRARGRSRRGRDVWGLDQVPLVTPKQAAHLDANARESGIAEAVLMESAGRAAAAIVAREWPSGAIGVIAGSGNNGGDAAVLARCLRAWGRDVTLFSAGSRPPDPRLYHGFEISPESGDLTAERLLKFDVLVDGILGTGATGPARGAARTAVCAMNEAGRTICALDLPSGVDAASGRVPGDAIRAVLTIQFGWPKIGLLLHPARSHCGRLVAVEIGFPPLEADASHGALITPEWAIRRLPRRAPDAHKGTAGRLLILAGSQGMAGAALIAAEAAFHAGAGLVRVASDPSNRLVIQTSIAEAIFLDRAHLDEESAGNVHALVAGPGLGTDPAGRSALDRALELTGDVAVALDADALNLLARDPEPLRRLASERDVVLTPHFMELSRLTGRALREIAADPVAAARAAAEDFGCVVLLKGQPSMVASPGQPLLVNSTGSSDLASAGMGDQLAGMIGAFLAAGANAREAAAVALYSGGRAADLAGRGRSLSPRDVSAHLPAAFRRPGAYRPPFGLPFVTFDQPARW
jgi:NAD(P)H-hydrate epimerase